MKKILSLIVLNAFMITILTGCATRLVDFTMISTKNIDLSRAANFQRGKSRVQGKDEASIIIFIPTKTINLKEAIDRAIESVPGAIALVDGVVTENMWWIPYIYGKSSYVVEGTPLIDPSLACTEFDSNYMIAQMDTKGKVRSFKYVSQDEFELTKARINRNQVSSDK